MHNYPNPNSLDGGLMMLGAIVLLILAGMLWIDKKLEERQDRQHRAIDEEVSRAIDEVGSEAYIHPDRTN